MYFPVSSSFSSGNNFFPLNSSISISSRSCRITLRSPFDPRGILNRYLSRCGKAAFFNFSTIFSSSSLRPPRITSDSNGIFSFPISFLMPSMNSVKGPRTSIAFLNAFPISSSAISLALHSTMVILSPSPITVNCRSQYSSSSAMGLTIRSPVSNPILTPAMGPSKGMGEMCTATHAAIKARMSGLFL